MEAGALVGRQVELQILCDLLIDASKGQGGTVFVESHAGMGKTTLLKAMREQCSHVPELGDMVFVQGECKQETGSQDAYEPFFEILTILLEGSKKRNTYEAILSILEDTVPDWLQVIPGVGPAVVASVKTGFSVKRHILDVNDDTHTELPKVLTRQYVNAITEIASTQNPLALIIEDAHWSDSASSGLLTRLVSKTREHPLAIVVAYRPSYINAEHPLFGIVREAKIDRLGRVIRLAGWSEDEIHNYVRQRYGESLNYDLTPWLHQLTEGHPFFVSQYLRLLDQDGIIRHKGAHYILDGELRYFAGEWKLSGKLGDEIAPPDDISEVLQQRIERLGEEDQRMLEMGAVQGYRFMSSILIELLRRDELEILDRLGEIEKQHHVIAFYATEEHQEKLDDIYAFEHVLMQQQFYKNLSPPERIRLHRRVGVALERVFHAQTDVPRKLVIDLARHNDLGKRPLRAARYYYLAAESTFSSGAFEETIELCRQALRLVRTLTGDTTNYNSLHAEIILLLLMASEIDWRGEPSPQDELSFVALVEEAEELASRSGDLTLLARAKFLKGKLLVVNRSRAEAIAVMEDALEIAQDAGDPLLESTIMSSLGIQKNGEDLVAGLKQLYQAHELYTDRLLPERDVHEGGLERHFYLLQGNIGLGEFDRGNFGKALGLLESTVTGLKRLGMRADVFRRSNYLGQIYVATGLFEKPKPCLLNH